MCLQFLWLLESSSNLSAQALPTLGSVNSVNSKTIGTASRISDTLHFYGHLCHQPPSSLSHPRGTVSHPQTVR